MTTYQAPAKLNLSLLLSPPRSDGYHPIESLVQTIEWCDLLEVEPGEGGDDLAVDGEAGVRVEDNLVLEALRAVRDTATVPALTMRLTKDIPVAAGLGGGSSDAAAALLACADLGMVSPSSLGSIAARVGADVSLFLTGGTLMMTGMGEEIEALRAADDFGVAVVVPEYAVSTGDAYSRWDDLEGPEGPAVPEERLPPSLRDGMPMRNDLLPAVLDLEPRLGDFIADVAAVWKTTVCLTGSGSACFGYFATVDEAADAAQAVSHLAVGARGLDLRPFGVRRLPERLDE
jgi:4-diphosphocytidyl-2-C-methyl-D-erythritol kinase